MPNSPFSRQTVTGLTVAEAAVILGCSEANVRHAVRHGKIAGRRLRIGWLLHPESVEAYRTRSNRRFHAVEPKAPRPRKTKAKAKQAKPANRKSRPAKSRPEVDLWVGDTMVVSEPLTGEQLQGEILSIEPTRILVKTAKGSFFVDRT